MYPENLCSFVDGTKSIQSHAHFLKHVPRRKMQVLQSQIFSLSALTQWSVSGNALIIETTVQCEKPLNNEVFCHRLLGISWVSLHNMESSGCFQYKKSPTPRSSVLSLVVFIFEVCPSKPHEEQNKDDGQGWVTILKFSHPILLFILTFKFKFTGLLGPWMWKKKFPLYLYLERVG